jgi:hypothetical protein
MNLCPVEVENPTQWNLIGRGISSPPPPVYIAQQYSSATFVSLHFLFFKEKFCAPFRNVIFVCLVFLNCQRLEFRNMKLRKLMWDYICTIFTRARL